MRNLFTFLFLGLLIGLVLLTNRYEAIPDPVIEEMADEMFLIKLKKEYLLEKDSSQMRKEALRKIYNSPYWGNLEKNY